MTSKTLQNQGYVLTEDTDYDFGQKHMNEDCNDILNLIDNIEDTPYFTATPFESTTKPTTFSSTSSIPDASQKCTGSRKRRAEPEESELDSQYSKKQVRAVRVFEHAYSEF